MVYNVICHTHTHAQVGFDPVQGRYSRPVRIRVFVSQTQRTIRIVDDCRGMAPDVLSRVVMGVGESHKRGLSFVNGQFGFGMQAFRAACARLTVRSRHGGAGADFTVGGLGQAAGDVYEISVDRSQSEGFMIQRAVAGADDS